MDPQDNQPPPSPSGQSGVVYSPTPESIGQVVVPHTADSSETAAKPETQTPPATANKLDPKTRVPNILPVTEPGERTICVIKRHPIGILGVYAMCFLVLAVTSVLAFIIVPGLSGGGNRQAILAGALVFIILATICIVYAVIAAKIYWGNNWTVTTDSLTQVRWFGLFQRQSSQLSLKDLEDVTAEQNGVVARIFNYGTLRVETAGESSKFVFPFCPNPNYYAQQILEARETFERNRRAEGVS